MQWTGGSIWGQKKNDRMPPSWNRPAAGMQPHLGNKTRHKTVWFLEGAPLPQGGKQSGEKGCLGLMAEDSGKASLERDGRLGWAWPGLWSPRRWGLLWEVESAVWLGLLPGWYVGPVASTSHPSQIP